MPGPEPCQDQSKARSGSNEDQSKANPSKATPGSEKPSQDQSKARLGTKIETECVEVQAGG